MEPKSSKLKAYQATAESLQSTFHEQVVEHIFIAELLQEAWLRYNKVVEVMHSEVDAYGYDLILECQGIVRHVQLKTSKHDAQTSYQKVGLALGAKPSGCVVWLLRTQPEDSVRFTLNYLFFGNGPGQKLPDLLATKDGKAVYPAAKHTKRNSAGERTVRPAIRQVKRSCFVPGAKEGMTMTQLFPLLFDTQQPWTPEKSETISAS